MKLVIELKKNINIVQFFLLFFFFFKYKLKIYIFLNNC